MEYAISFRDRLLRQLRAALPFRDSAQNPVFVLTGSGRSGTTWLAEILADSVKGRLVFEPFRPGIVPDLAELNNRQYLRPGDPATEFHSGIETILRGRIRTRWSDRYNCRFSYEARIIKEIRANLMVGWMLDAFPDIRVIHVVRDPFSTMASHKVGRWKFDNSKFTIQPDLLTDHLRPFGSLIEQADSEEKAAALHWAVENYVPIRQARSGKWPSNRIMIKSYDKLRQNQEEMSEFFSFAGVEPDKIDWDRVKRPSRVSRGRTDFSHAPASQTFKPETIDYTLALLKAFDLGEWAQYLPSRNEQ